MTIRNKNDFYLSVILICFSALLYRETANIDISIIYALGSQFFPRTILIFMGIMSVLLFIRSIDFKRQHNGESSKSQAWVKENFLQVGVVGMLFAYLIALPRLGYVPSTIGFVFLTIFILGPKTKKDIAIYLAIALFVAFLLEYIFASVLKLFLP